MMSSRKSFEYKNNSSGLQHKQRQLPTIRGIIGEAIPFTYHPMGRSKIQKIISKPFHGITPDTPILIGKDDRSKIIFMKSPHRAKFDAIQKFAEKNKSILFPEFSNFRMKIKKQDVMVGLTSTSVKISGKKMQKSSTKSQKLSDQLPINQRTETSECNEQNPQQINQTPKLQSKKNYATRTNLIEYTNIRQKINRKSRYNQVKLVPKYKFLLGTGNNSELIRQILKRRGNWIQTNQYDTLFNLRWQQQSEKAVYTKLQYSKYKQMINHLQNHQLISSKGGLTRTLSKFCRRNNIQLFDIIPISFVFNWDQHDKLQQQMKRFIYYYAENHPYCKQSINKNKQYIDIMKLIARNSKALNFGFQKTKITSYPLLSDAYKTQNIEDSPYLWIIKPSDCNRGIGIKLFSSLDQLVKIIKKWQQTKMFRNQFVIQKYIQRPKLIKNRKFDIRVWMLINNSGDGYFFEQGYIRTSSEDFQTAGSQLQNQFVHLTNNAIQKNNPNYGIFQQGNQLSFTKYTEYVGDQTNFKEKFLPRIKNLCSLIIEASKKKIIVSQNTFQIFGLDFMIDYNDALWLIEVNTNPCIELSSALISKIVPRMLDDAFKLIIDPIFKPSIGLNQSYRYPLEGYQDDRNLWQKLQPFSKQQFLTKFQIIAQKTDDIDQNINSS